MCQFGSSSRSDLCCSDWSLVTWGYCKIPFISLRDWGCPLEKPFCRLKFDICSLFAKTSGAFSLGAKDGCGCFPHCSEERLFTVSWGLVMWLPRGRSGCFRRGVRELLSRWEFHDWIRNSLAPGQWPQQSSDEDKEPGVRVQVLRMFLKSFFFFLNVILFHVSLFPVTWMFF